MQNFKLYEDLPHSEMIYIKGGTFMMGSKDYDDEQPIHEVTVPDFYIGKYPVTQALWKRVVGNNPSHFRGENRPVEQVSWDDIYNDFLPGLNTTKFLERIKSKEAINHFKDIKFDLPSEAQWEYAAKANEEYEYSGSDDLGEVGWYRENSYRETKPVGLKAPNGFGLHDMSGNVWEWCADTWHNNYEGAPTDGSAWTDDSSSYRVRRGGGWFSYDADCRTTNRSYLYRNTRYFYVGFRLGFVFSV